MTAEREQIGVDEAFTALVKRVEDVQMEVFACGTREADWLLRLPQSIASLAHPVKVCLDNLLKSTAYQGSLIFRGRMARPDGPRTSGRGRAGSASARPPPD